MFSICFELPPINRAEKQQVYFLLFLSFHDFLLHWGNIWRYALRQKSVIMRLLALLDYVERFGFSVAGKIFHKRWLFRLGRHVVGWLLCNFPHSGFIEDLVPNLRILDVYHDWIVYSGFLFCCSYLQTTRCKFSFILVK